MAVWRIVRTKWGNSEWQYKKHMEEMADTWEEYGSGRLAPLVGIEVQGKSLGDSGRETRLLWASSIHALEMIRFLAKLVFPSAVTLRLVSFSAFQHKL